MELVSCAALQEAVEEHDPKQVEASNVSEVFWPILPLDIDVKFNVILVEPNNAKERVGASNVGCYNGWFLLDHKLSG